jgi:hypothetical protein
MKMSYIIILSCILLAGLAVMPVSAFTANTLDFKIDEKGDAQVVMTYSLNAIEGGAIVAKGVGSVGVVQALVDESLPYSAKVKTVELGKATMTIPGFATGNAGIKTTKEFSMQPAQDKASKYWFEFGSNFAPKETTITFENGKVYTYKNQMRIPTTSNT